MGLFDMFRRKCSETPPQETTVPLEQSSYDIAYFILPHYVFQSLDQMIDLCIKTPSVAGPFYYVMACKGRGIEPDMESGKQFLWHKGEFGGRNYLALEYPSPPPIDMGDSDPLKLLESGTKLVLAPYFSVILYGNDSSPSYFILDQAPIGGGTTVRSITSDGMNCNLGPGPEPRLELFFEAIRERKSGATN